MRNRRKTYDIYPSNLYTTSIKTIHLAIRLFIILKNSYKKISSRGNKITKINVIIINLTPQRTSGPRPSGQAVPLSIYLGTVGVFKFIV